jgi:hypothetical protein
VSTPPDPFSSEEQRSSLPEEAVSPPQNEEEAPSTSSETDTPTSSTTEEVPGKPVLPPEALGETNGGPLGCCLGVMIGLLLSLSIAVLSRFYTDPLIHIFSTNLSTAIRIAMLLLAIVAIIICGNLGWKIGKRAYREYDQPVVRVRSKRSNTSRKVRHT